MKSLLRTAAGAETSISIKLIEVLHEKATTIFSLLAFSNFSHDHYSKFTRLGR